MLWLRRHQRTVLALIAFFCTGVVVLAQLFPMAPFLSVFWRGEHAFADLLRKEGRKTPTRQDFVFVGIDQGSLELQELAPTESEPQEEVQAWKNNRAFQLMTERRFPWSRELWALLLDRLIGSGGAKLVIFDMVFSKPDVGDPIFRAALERYRDQVVVGANFDFSQSQNGTQVAMNVPPNSDLIPAPQMEDDRVGYVVFFPDPVDKQIRSVRYIVTDRQLKGDLPLPDEKPYEALSARALEKLAHGDDVPRDLQAHLLRFSALNAYPPHPLWEIFEPRLWHANYGDGAFFKNKVIVVGASSQIAHDVFSTPIDRLTPGPALHLFALAAALDHEFIREAPVWVDFVGICLAGFSAWLVLTFLQRPLFCILALAAITVAYLGAARVSYDRFGLLIMVVPTLAAFTASGLLGLGFEYALERIERMRTRRTLERYVSKNLVKAVLDNPTSYYSSMLGSRRPVTVLFSDLVGFTSMSEEADPTALVTQLNEYFSKMVPHVFNNEGTLDKFIGDAVMAIWGNVSSRGTIEDAKAAVRAASGMRASLKELNKHWRMEGKTELAFGIGINHGEALVGNIGSYAPYERLDPTVVGDAVNLASRLEGLTRIYSVDILLSESVCNLVRDEFHLRTVARVQVKGKSRPVDTAALIGARTDPIDPEFLKWLETYEDGIRTFRERNFRQAKILFSRFLEFYPEDDLAKMYLERALEYEKKPPDEAWNAVEVFKKK
jgi:adenylate cyclase